MTKKPFAVDIDLLKKYDRPGPRYTSYPTAPHFHADFGTADFTREILVTNQGDTTRDLSLYFHLPFCDTLCYFCACNMMVTRNKQKIAGYLDNLKTEIRLISQNLNSSRRVVQLHWGGGTPTYLSVGQIRDLCACIRDHFHFTENAEISIEIDPRALSEDHLPILKEMGFNRVSFGVQDFHEQVQKTVNRIQPETMSRNVVAASRQLGFDSINIDLMYGLPYQTVESYRTTLDTIIDINPDRLAVFNFAYVPWLKKHQKLIPIEALPSAPVKLEMLKMIIERLTGAGYVYIGMDHFAKPDDELARALENHTLYRNFQGYSTYANAEVYAMGITSISQLERVYAQNVKDLKSYQQLLSENKIPTGVGCRLSDDDVLRRHVITEIMCNNRLIKADVEDRFNIVFDDYFAVAIEQLKHFTDDQLLELHPDRIQVTQSGRLVVRNIAMAFDAYLEQDRQSQRPMYSRTV